jgi:hypothetical protein
MKRNDLLEDREGDKAVVIDTTTTASGRTMVKVRWWHNDQESGFIPADRFTNLSEIVRELEAQATPEPQDQWCPVCKTYHKNVGEKTDSGYVTRPCPISPLTAPWNQIEVIVHGDKIRTVRR